MPRVSARPGAVGINPTEMRVAQAEAESPSRRAVFRLIEKELKVSQELHEELFETALIGFMTLSSRGRILSINRTGARLLGKRRQELIEQPFAPFIAKSDQPKYRRQLALCRDRPGQRVSTELWLDPNPGGRRSLCVEFISLATRHQDAVHRKVYQNVLIDATRRKVAEKALQEAHERLEQRVTERTMELTRSNLVLAAEIAERKDAQRILRIREKNLADFFEHAPLGLLWVDPQGKILRMNRAAMEILGCQLEEGLRLSLQSFYDDRQLVREHLRRLASQEALHHHRVRLRESKGQTRHALVDANGLWEEGRMVYSRWFLRDITHQIELEREILAIAEREQRRIGRDLHDDICQQLTGIQFLCKRLARQLEKLSESSSRRALEIEELVGQAIDHTRELAHGLSPVELESHGLPDVLQELAQRTRKLFRIDCRFRRPPRDLIYDKRHATDLFRIVQEAVANAIKHGRAKRVDISLARRGNRLVLTVKDDGVGMPPDANRAKGMGLKVMHYRAHVVHGTLTMRRNSGGGTTVICSVRDKH